MHAPDASSISIPAASGPSAAGALRRQLAAAARFVDTMDAFDLTATMTLFLLIFYGGDYWYLKVPLSVLCIAALIHPPLRRSPELWLTATGILFLGNLKNWYVIDNHKYLITYWTFGMTVALWTGRPTEGLARIGRALIGIAFLFATVWKALSPDYASGTFFHHTLLMDGRFSILARALGGLTPQMVLENNRLANALTALDSARTEVRLHTTPLVEGVAQFMTWWTIGIEATIALLFLLPTRWRLSNLRDPVLILFLLSTYSIAPVIGFGWVLAVMGLAQAGAAYRFTRLGYVASFAALQLFRIPWKSFF